MINCTDCPDGTPPPSATSPARLQKGVAFGTGVLSLDIGVEPVIALRSEGGSYGALLMIEHEVAGYADRVELALAMALERFAAHKIEPSSLECVLVGGSDQSRWKNRIMARVVRALGHPVSESDLLGLWYRHVDFDPAQGALRIYKEKINPDHTSPARANLSLDDGSRGFTQGQIGGVVANATRFFRMRPTFTALRDVILPEHLRHSPQRPFLLWCAACSNGAEAYSYAMYLHRLMARAGAQCPFHVFATDINERLIVSARAGVYELHTKEIEQYEKYFSRYGRVEGGGVIFGEEIKRCITFERFDLKEKPTKRRFRVIIAANVLQYYEESAREHILGNLVSVCESPGFIHASPVGPYSAARFGLTPLRAYQMLRRE